MSNLQYKVELLESKLDLLDSFISKLQTSVNNSNDINDLKANINKLIEEYNNESS